jgi:hypothetical protein
VLEQAGRVYEEIVLDELTNPEHVALVFDAGASTPWFDEVPWSR